MLLTRFTSSLPLLAGLTFGSLAGAQQSSNGLDWIPFNRDQFSDNIALDDDGNVQLFWKTGNNSSTFGIASQSSGYLAVGLSQTGAMTGGDIAVGYNNDDGQFVFENRHAEGFVTPQVSPDQEKNMRLIEGSQADGVTSFIFEKQNEADCLETQGIVHTDAWQWFIYAFSDDNTFAIHKPGHNGKKYVKLGTGDSVSTLDSSPIPNTRNLTITQPEVTVPTAETTYCYSLHRMPAGKGWIVGERPPNASPLLHHEVFYACYDLDEQYLEMLDGEPNCDYQNFANPCNGFVTEWAPGMSGRTFEPGYGKPFGEGHYEYVMLETHYNNPEHLEGEKDEASYTFLWTDEEVETEVGTLTLGDLQVEGWFLEPGQPLIKHATVCTPECTESWPDEGITAVAVFHHMHFRGRNAQVQIIRDGKEIAPLSTLRDFEYGNQFSKSLDSIQLMPGDKLITTCEYDTSNDTEPVPGGLASNEEMCFAWVDYYPANTVLACTQFDLGESPENPLNGTAAICLDSAKAQPDVYPSKFLTSDFEPLPPTGDQCAASEAPSDSSNTSGDATVLTTCPETDVCFSLNIPEQSASSTDGDIFFQISAPTSYAWVALAQGTQMSGANMFVVYSSADSQNVTLSPRTTGGHVMPTRNDAADVSLLEGSGIVDGKMVANVRCGSCQDWGTGSMGLQGTTSDWIYAHRSGVAIDSDDVNVSIDQHDRNGAFQWDLTQATGGSSANPFTDAAANTSTSAAGGGQNSWSRVSSEAQNRFLVAHGSLASLAFVAIFPIGGILVRLASFNHLAWVHGGLQILGYAVFISAAGIGIFMADGLDYLTEPHAIIGMLLLAVLFFMPFLGALHHKMYKSVQKRTLWSYAHIFTGRASIVLGMVNGGLGLKLAAAHGAGTIAYGVFAGVMGVAYIGAVVFGELKRARKSSQGSLPTQREAKQVRHADSGSDSG